MQQLRVAKHGELRHLGPKSTGRECEVQKKFQKDGGDVVTDYLRHGKTRN